MDDAKFVRRVQRVGDLLRDRQRLSKRDRSGSDAVRQRWTLDELHHERRRGP